MTTPRNGLARHDPDALRAARTAARLTQMELAAAAGCSQPYLSMLEWGTQIPGEKLLASLADALGVTVGDLRPRAGTPS